MFLQYLQASKFPVSIPELQLRRKQMDRDNVLAAAEKEILFLFKNEILKDLS